MSIDNFRPQAYLSSSDNVCSFAEFTLCAVIIAAVVIDAPVTGKTGVSAAYTTVGKNYVC